MTALGAGVPRLEGHEKVTGTARYSYERTPDGCVYAWPVQSTEAPSRIAAIDVAAVLAMPGVVDVITHEDAERLNDADDGELLVLQSPDVAYRGQVVALVVAESLETARAAADALHVEYDARPVDAVLTPGHPKLYAPEEVNAGFETDTRVGDLDQALAQADVVLDRTYSTPALFNNPMEPHASVATWSDGRLHVFESSQGSTATVEVLSTLFDVPADAITVDSQHVGGGFGSKGSPRPNVVLAVLAARRTGRPVKIAYSRQMMFSIAGYRTPTISRVRLAANDDGRLLGIAHDAQSQTSTIEEFAEQTAEATRHMYAAPHRSTTHRVAALDVPTPRWMRAPGECPGMYALESAIDELAHELAIDPVELRVLNEPASDPETGKEFSSRHLVDCLRRGTEIFGWDGRDATPGARQEGRWLIGTGVASALYPAMVSGSSARATARSDGTFLVQINATDIGTGARTVLAQIAADRLGVDVERIDIRIGSSALPPGAIAGGSAGTASWGWPVAKACAELAERLAAGERIPADGLVVEADTSDDVDAMDDVDRHAYGAHFAEVRVDLDSGEIVVARMVGVFAAGRILNARTARSQLIGGMTMGVSMALHEHGVMDERRGDYVNHDLATYHVAACADIPDFHVEWLEEHDEHLNPVGGKGIGEIGIVGSAAAVANAVWHATGVRVRDLPVQPDALVGRLPHRA
ncbi:xanthine dehydrogenase family protein molybdopterin-binding subunit [Aeromicrobium wangtongii]|uniref:xanthine dehydrogenase family protein molybdopterin-binding subunit n=1 Tax=Aeromicrobium wangtongii TaxID=2969247 RepID=UPI002018019A|nr:xanthine dehydrogenase family protein molybdopterin-binding subunit [Aeromicrobium wangtongii]MCL3819648.1 xanthine dehydrogenase family protein molybdopterin-binding subunit [Aeromicrobium wangtongii]